MRTTLCNLALAGLLGLIIVGVVFFRPSGGSGSGPAPVLRSTPVPAETRTAASRAGPADPRRAVAIAEFSKALAAGGAEADVNGDGRLDAADAVAFADRLKAGN